MKRQNPPQAYLDKAQSIEKYLAPATLALIYAIAASAWAILISAVFIALVYLSAANPTPLLITIFTMLAFVPSIFAAVAWFLRPDDAVSSYINRLVALWRNPINLTADQCDFKVRLMSGDVLGIHLALYYPSKAQTAELKEQLYTFAHSALSKVCSMHYSAPAEQEVEEAIDPALETIADQFELPVLYAEVCEVYKDQDAYTFIEEDPLPQEFLSTGTHG